MPHSLDRYLGRSCVFIESGAACVGTVETVEIAEGETSAVFRLVPNSFRCRLRLFRSGSEDAIEHVLQEPPFGDTWSVMVSNKEFYVEDDHWQATFLFGGGFRIFFQPSFVKRFLTGDVAWLDEYYNDVEQDDWDESGS